MLKAVDMLKSNIQERFSRLAILRFTETLLKISCWCTILTKYRKYLQLYKCYGYFNIVFRQHIIFKTLVKVTTFNTFIKLTYLLR